jgi:hypothetical protein
MKRSKNERHDEKDETCNDNEGCPMVFYKQMFMNQWLQSPQKGNEYSKKYKYDFHVYILLFGKKIMG